MVAPAEPIAVGMHQLRIQEDIVFLTQIGDYKLEEVVRVLREIENVFVHHGRAFFMLDMIRAEKTTLEARHLIADWNKQHRISGMVIFGENAAARAVASLAIAAIRLFRGDNVPTVFTATEAEARAWIATQRKLLLQMCCALECAVMERQRQPLAPRVAVLMACRIIVSMRSPQAPRRAASV